MNYRNAQDIFPENLLKQIQRYVSGETIYIPAKNANRFVRTQHRSRRRHEI